MAQASTLLEPNLSFQSKSKFHFIYLYLLSIQRIFISQLVQLLVKKYVEQYSQRYRTLSTDKWTIESCMSLTESFPLWPLCWIHFLLQNKYPEEKKGNSADQIFICNNNTDTLNFPIDKSSQRKMECGKGVAMASKQSIV